jgi:hypothetical protein
MSHSWDTTMNLCGALYTHLPLCDIKVSNSKANMSITALLTQLPSSHLDLPIISSDHGLLLRPALLPKSKQWLTLAEFTSS